jgi:hypothetical protein
MKKFSMGDFLNAEFYSSGIDNKELEKLIRETIEKEHPGDPIVRFDYTEEGVEVYLSSGEIIIIDIDWNEIILS